MARVLCTGLALALATVVVGAAGPARAQSPFAEPETAWVPATGTAQAQGLKPAANAPASVRLVALPEVEQHRHKARELYIGGAVLAAASVALIGLGAWAAVQAAEVQTCNTPPMDAASRSDCATADATQRTNAVVSGAMLLFGAGAGVGALVSILTGHRHARRAAQLQPQLGFAPSPTGAFATLRLRF